MTPMTVAVESATTPAVAITPASTSRTQNRVDDRLRHGPSMVSESTTRETSDGASEANGTSELDDRRR